jgi:hypothetical protein
MVQACSLLSAMFEDMQEDESRVFHLPNVDHETLVLLVALLHNTRSVRSVTGVVEIRNVLLAMDYLGCRSKWSKLVARLWQLIRLLPNTEGTFHVMCENASLIMPEYSVPFLNKAKTIHPEWSRFREILGEMDMTPQLAVHCVTTLIAVFPPLLIARGIIESSPPTHLHQILAAVITMPRIGVHFHPEEWMLLLESCIDSAHTHAKSDPFTALARACVDSYKGVNVPLCVSKITGSFIFFQHKARCSFLLTLKRPLAKKARVQFQNGTATFDIDGERGTVHATLQLHRFHDNAESVDDAYIRLVPMYVAELGGHALDYDGMHDTWHTVDIDHRTKGTISHCTELPLTTFPLLKHLRFDVFWLHDPRVV